MTKCLMVSIENVSLTKLHLRGLQNSMSELQYSLDMSAILSHVWAKYQNFQESVYNHMACSAGDDMQLTHLHVHIDFKTIFCQI